MFSTAIRPAYWHGIALALAIAAHGTHAGNARSVDHHLRLVQDHSRFRREGDAGAAARAVATRIAHC